MSYKSVDVSSNICNYNKHILEPLIHDPRQTGQRLERKTSQQSEEQENSF